MSIRINNFSAYNQNYKNTKPAFGAKATAPKELTGNAAAIWDVMQTGTLSPEGMRKVRVWAKNIPSSAEKKQLQQNLTDLALTDKHNNGFVRFIGDTFGITIPKK